MTGYPTTLFFDANGTLVYQHMGPLSEAALLSRLESVFQAVAADYRTLSMDSTVSKICASALSMASAVASPLWLVMMKTPS